MCVYMHAQYGKLCTIVKAACELYIIELTCQTLLTIYQSAACHFGADLPHPLTQSYYIPLSLLPFNMVGHCCREGAV